MIQTITAIYKTASTLEAQVLVVSPFGCGTFKNPVTEVAWIFAEAFQHCYQDMRLVVAISTDHNSVADMADAFAQALWAQGLHLPENLRRTDLLYVFENLRNSD